MVDQLYFYFRVFEYTHNYEFHVIHIQGILIRLNEMLVSHSESIIFCRKIRKKHIEKIMSL